MGSSSSRRQYDYDLVVVGAGSAGLTASTFASDLGAKVLLIERRSVLGGDCTWNGCVPSKALIAAAHAASAHRGGKARAFFDKEEGFDAGSNVGRYVKKVRERVYSLETPEILQAEHGVETRFGDAVFESDHSVRVGTEVVTFWKLLLNTGSRPVIPKEFQGLPIDTNETIFDDPPATGTSLAVIGGGPIGSELAQACRRLGAEVVVFTGTRGLLPRERPDAREVVVVAFQDDGIEIIQAPKSKHSAVKSATVDTNDKIVFHLHDDLGKKTFDRVLVAAGRECVVPTSVDEVLGLQVDPKKSGGLLVDPKTLLCQAKKNRNRHIFAAGDCIANGPQFTHIAGVQGYIASRNALLPGNDDASHTLDINQVPRVTYTDPEVGSVGLADIPTASRVLKLPENRFDVMKWTAEKNDRALCESDDPSFVELILLLTTGGKAAKILGGTVVGARAGELLSEIAVIAHHKLTTLQVAKVIHPYPTFSFVIMLMCSKDATSRFLHNSFLGRSLKSHFSKSRAPSSSSGPAQPVAPSS